VVRDGAPLANDPRRGLLVRRLIPALRDHLRRRLPEYMMPAAFLLLDALPVTANGKLDRKALPPPDSLRPEAHGTYAAPRDRRESLLAEVWSQVLGLEQVGIHDNFFELGGDSILSIQVIARAAAFGLQLSPRQLFQHQTVAELAAVAVEAGPGRLAEQEEAVGPVPLTPIQHWFFAQEQPAAHHWNLAVLLALRRPVAPALFEQALARLLVHHDALRLRFEPTTEGWRQWYQPAGGCTPFTACDLSALPAARRTTALESAAAALQASLNLAHGPLLRAACCDLGDRGHRLFLTIHHLVVDGVSWRILLEDLQTALAALERTGTWQPLPKTTSYRRWAEGLRELATGGALAGERDHWLATRAPGVPALPVDLPGGGNLEPSARTISVALDAAATDRLLREVPEVYHTQINDVLLTALALALAPWMGGRTLLIDLEGHGREEIVEGVDLSRSVGWFTAIFPVRLDLTGAAGPAEALVAVKEQLRAVPGRGVGYGLLRSLDAGPGAEAFRERLQALPAAEVVFNYLGRFDDLVAEASLFAPAAEHPGPIRGPRAKRHHLLEVYGRVVGGCFHADFEYSDTLHCPATVEALAERFRARLVELIDHCLSAGAGGFTPSDFPESDLSQDELDHLLAELS
jgi:non-ribosomal peptide synthase protein (TIGR01720 family)